MILTQTLQKWGNSAGVRLPKNVIKAAGLDIDQKLAITVQDNSIILTPLNDKELTLESMLKGVTPNKVGGEINWGEDVGAERYE